MNTRHQFRKERVLGARRLLDDLSPGHVTPHVRRVLNTIIDEIIELQEELHGHPDAGVGDRPGMPTGADHHH